MTYSCRLAFLTLSLAAALAVAGCGGTVIDDVKTEEALKQNVEDSLGQRVIAVECPSGVDVEPKATFQCTIDLAKGEDQKATLRILNDDADVEVVELSSGDVALDLGK